MGIIPERIGGNDDRKIMSMEATFPTQIRRNPQI